ncbi:ADP-ribosyltransferase [Gordonia phage GodonK]|uniref:ADP-ribosyltransferase n=1 Tax=Gordonia phage GodonK TaxID=2562192 RepID=A0A4D6E1X4_9CAUD|nr:phosphatase [Gordonia phage GodonK]QBZ72669.1 ADP-ribosyltransferase [Gordonia phage GodonK]
MTFYRKQGDMFSEHADAYAHGVNTMGRMGAGVAKIVADTWPECRDAYIAMCAHGFNPGETYAWRSDTGIWVYNVASQRFPGRDARLYWLKDGLEDMYLHARGNLVKSISMPVIGGGIGGLDPNDCITTIENVAAQYPDVTTTVWEY